MRRAVVMLLATITVAACSGSDAAPPPLDTEPPTTIAPTTEPPPTVETTDAAASTTEPTTTPTTTTTIDDATILAQAEADFFEAWQVGTDAIRNPDDPDNEARVRDHFAEGNLDLVLENIQLARDGNLIAKENSDNPSFAQTYGDAAFTNDSGDEVSLTVCEFYSDQLFERGTAPDGSDALIRDSPLTSILVVDLILEDGQWKSATGGVAEEVRDEVERCTTAS